MREKKLHQCYNSDVNTIYVRKEIHNNDEYEWIIFEISHNWQELRDQKNLICCGITSSGYVWNVV